MAEKIIDDMSDILDRIVAMVDKEVGGDIEIHGMSLRHLVIVILLCEAIAKGK